MLGHDIQQVRIRQVTRESITAMEDEVAVEEPLELRLGYEANGHRTEQTICVTMRTPGPDVELALGFLFAEGVIRGMQDVRRLRHSGPRGDKRSNRNVLTVELEAGVPVSMRRLERNVFTTSSCGVCGTPSLEALGAAACPDLPPPRPMLDPDVVHRLPNALFAEQATFQQTGGLHAAALFDAAGRLQRVREDVGRHNALDKLVGSCLLERMLPLHDRIVLVSGRASYELVQKALVAGVPVLAAVGAPSSLAVELARAHGLTLLGFVQSTRYNVYSGAERLFGVQTPPIPADAERGS